jgi:hypothetical protein
MLIWPYLWNIFAYFSNLYMCISFIDIFLCTEHLCEYRYKHMCKYICTYTYLYIFICAHTCISRFCRRWRSWNCYGQSYLLSSISYPLSLILYVLSSISYPLSLTLYLLPSISYSLSLTLYLLPSISYPLSLTL